MERINLREAVLQLTSKGIQNVAARAGESDRRDLRESADTLRTRFAQEPWVADRSQLPPEDFLREILREGMDRIRRA